MINLAFCIIVFSPRNKYFISSCNFFSVFRDDIDTIFHLCHNFIIFTKHRLLIACILHNRILCKELVRKYLLIKNLQCIVHIFRRLPSIDPSCIWVTILHTTEQIMLLKNIRLIIFHKTNQISCRFQIRCHWLHLNSMCEHTVRCHLIRIFRSKNDVTTRNIFNQFIHRPSCTKEYIHIGRIYLSIGIFVIQLSEPSIQTIFTLIQIIIFTYNLFWRIIPAPRCLICEQSSKLRRFRINIRMIDMDSYLGIIFFRVFK